MTHVFVSLLGALLLSIPSQPASAQNAAMRIVVVEGEDAVNIIQQKTAVAPVVEVRDRNNLPVAGVAVTFSVGGQGASFGGLSTLTVTTNAAGQAAAAGFTPTAAGAIHINATALVQGQALTATITQTNVLTAAQAAGAASATGGATGGAGSSGSASAGGAAAGGGGGMSATTIGIVGAAVGGGALAATQVIGKDQEDDGKREFAGPFSGQLSLVFSACTRVHENSGTLTIEINNLNGPFTGTAHVGGTSRVIAFSSGNCPNGPQIGTNETMGVSPFPISGTTPAISFTKSESNTVPAPFPNQPSTLSTQEFSFTGTLSGDTITGTLTQTIRGETAGAPTGVGAATYAVTLRPH